MLPLEGITVVSLEQAVAAPFTTRQLADLGARVIKDRWRDVVTPAGVVRSLLPPVTVAGREAAMGAVPEVGQHTESIRAEHGPGPAVTRESAP